MSVCLAVTIRVEANCTVALPNLLESNAVLMPQMRSSRFHFPSSYNILSEADNREL